MNFEVKLNLGLVPTIILACVASLLLCKIFKLDLRYLIKMFEILWPPLKRER